MKRYWLFGGENYYAKGGMNDYRAMADEIYMLTAAASEMVNADVIEWWHVVDTMSFQIVARSEWQAFNVRGNDFVPDL